MSDPAASIKSIFSGKVPLTPDIEYEDFESNRSFESMGRDDYDLERKSTDSNTSTPRSASQVTHQIMPLYRANRPIDSSRGSIDSDEDRVNEEKARGSEYTSMSVTDYSATPSEPVSRPLSRSSLNSCVSTTATKDGIEGRRLHKKGPSTYSSNIISSMLSTQQKPQVKYGAPEQLEAPMVPPYTWYRDDRITASYSETNDSNTSLKTTRAETDGEHGQGGMKSNALSNISSSLPSVTLKEKIEMLDEKNRHGANSGLAQLSLDHSHTKS